MGETSIEWTDATWNPTRGCSRISPGCGGGTPGGGGGCYAERIAARFSGPGMAYEGLAEMTPDGARWTGRIRLVEEKLEEPLSWRRPRRVFVNSMSDLFHEGLSDADVLRVFELIRICAAKERGHTFQVLTKRAERMRDFCSRLDFDPGSADGARPHRLYLNKEVQPNRRGTPTSFVPHLKNLWLGVSVDNQKYADLRVPALLKTPVAMRFLSCEPLLGPVDLARVVGEWEGRNDTWPRRLWDCLACAGTGYFQVAPFIAPCSSCSSPMAQRGPGVGVRWVIAGAESGHGARPMDEEWVRSLRDQCTAASVPFFYKQKLVGGHKVPTPPLDGKIWRQFPEVRP